jgi:uncharacterized protein YyaL (SSP411 family)
MHRLLWAIVALSLSFAVAGASSLHWEPGLQEAFEKARAERKPLMVMVVTRNCRWCKKMKTRTLSDPAVTSRLQRFVLVHVDREKVDSSVIPYAKFVPTIYFMTPQQKILERVVGYFNKDDFLRWIDDVDTKLGYRAP